MYGFLTRSSIHSNKLEACAVKNTEVMNAFIFTAPLLSLSCSVIPVDVPVNVAESVTTTITTTTHPGVYWISCSPVIRGCHQVTVHVNDAQLIISGPFLDTITPLSNIGGLRKPWGVAVTDDKHLVVRITLTILDRKGKKLKSFEDVEFYRPHGIAITRDNFIVVADNHKLQKITMDGKCVMSVGKEGSGTHQFCNPHGVTVSPATGHIYVADRNNDRIKVFNSDLTVSHALIWQKRIS